MREEETSLHFSGRKKLATDDSEEVCDGGDVQHFLVDFTSPCVSLTLAREEAKEINRASLWRGVVTAIQSPATR